MAYLFWILIILITSKDHAIVDDNGFKYDIDVKSNGGCIIIPPSYYHNKNLKKDVEYTWKYDIFHYDMSEVPKWILNLLLKKQNNISSTSKRSKHSTVVTSLDNIKITKKKSKATKIPKDDLVDDVDVDTNKDNDNSDNNTQLIVVNKQNLDNTEKNMSLDELEQYIYILGKDRADDYNKWVEVGFCLFNINKNSLYIWKKFSKQCKKYNEK
jgi:hypothetical protein